MDTDRIVAVIMAGGEGTRFWPRSRRSVPKQFLSFSGDRSLLQMSIERLEGLVPKSQTLVVTGREHAALARSTTRLPERSVVAEPQLRDTAACIGFGARLAQAVREDAVMVVLCADHVIQPIDEFQEVLKRAVEVADSSDSLVTIGLRPDRPAIGYGYIETGEKVDDLRPVAREVVRFREKPDLETARRFVLAGKFLWNSGMFAFRPQTVLKALQECRPDLHACLEEITDPFDREQVERAYAKMPRISFDIAVLESAPNKRVVEANFNWDDLGTFEGIARHTDVPDDGNVARGEAEFIGCENVLVDNDEDGLVVVSNLSDIMVVRTKDAILVVPRRDAESVKQIVRELQERGHDRYL